MEKHQQNLDFYLANGGDPKFARMHHLPTLENRARITYLISKLTISKVEIIEKPRQPLDSVGQIPEQETPEPSKPKFLGLIAQYPADLHPTYQQAYQLWISVCSLKVQLNEVPKQDDKTAFDLQTEMLNKMEMFDKCKDALDHYNEHKRILPTATKTDFSSLSPMELLNKRNGLRGLITRRKQTISKLETELPEFNALNYHKKLSAINRKKEQLQELILDEKKLSEMIIG